MFGSFQGWGFAKVSETFSKGIPQGAVGSFWRCLQLLEPRVWWQEGFGGLAVPGGDSCAGRLEMGCGAFQPEVSTEQLGLRGVIRAGQSH